MENLLGKIEAYLSKNEIEISDDLVFLINTRIKPPLPVRREDIHIRAMYLVSDQVNSFGGCFPLEEHPRLAQLLVDSPVIVGHSKERLPIARNFKADLLKKDGTNWVKVYFYWLKNSPEADSLKDNIDHGIYKECSIGFSFEFPECSICSQDMRRCPHIPFRTYQKETGEKTQACYNYRHIIKVHETSLVYRGAVFGTSITNELNLFQKHDCADGVCKYNRVYKETVFASLRKAGLEKEVKSVGKIAEKGYTEDEIELYCQKDLEQKVLNSLPQIFRNRVSFIRAKDSFKPCRFILQNHSQKKPEDHIVRFENGKKQSTLCLYRFDLNQLGKGRRFLCRFLEDAEAKELLDNTAQSLDKGKCTKEKETKSYISLKLEGKILRGDFLLRKVKIKDKERWLFIKCSPCSVD